MLLNSYGIFYFKMFEHADDITVFTQIHDNFELKLTPSPVYRRYTWQIINVLFSMYNFPCALDINLLYFFHV